MTLTYISDLGPAHEDGEDDGHVAHDGERDDDAEHADLDEVDVGGVVVVRRRRWRMLVGRGEVAAAIRSSGCGLQQKRFMLIC